MHQPCQDQLLLLPNFSQVSFEAFVRIESNQFSKTKIFVIHLTHHQVIKSSQNNKIMEFGHAPTMSRSIPFAPKLLPHYFGGICDDWVQPVSQNQDFRFSPQTPPSHKIKPKHQNHELGYAPTMSRSTPFAPKLFPHHFAGICEDWVQPVFENHDFLFSPHTPPSHKIKPKHQNHGTCLCTNNVKINSFCSQTSPALLWRHLWGLSPASFPKPRFLFFTPHTTKSQNQAKTPKAWNLAMHQPCPDQFLLPPSFSHITLEAFVRIESSEFSKPWFSLHTFESYIYGSSSFPFFSPNQTNHNQGRKQWRPYLPSTSSRPFS